MSYEVASVPNLLSGEISFRLTSEPGEGAYVAAMWKCTRASDNSVECSWIVRLVTAAGRPVKDAKGAVLTGQAQQRLSVPDITAAGGINEVKARLLKTALGEPGAAFDVPSDIRDVIQAAAFIA